ncbi:hypothetical protein RhiXN_09074 [Rhizoctonia solani]|uniref:DUF6534 domain-containing protein n=1 Tax=Rhizoctonia solani TaxID=456999 RepID=A0A8H8SW94_9AGAM|nr:uncharacterized protein RhiXN_09074 [Rhizoctonia solani]QRW20099.1 hypothetical protein RhiXN_09074 [Rhizoctonia solani]
MAAMDLLLGPILLGTIVNIWLYGIMVTQTTMYYVAFPRDHRWIKTLVGYMFVVDTLNSIFDIGLVWKYTITLFGDHDGILVSSWWFNVALDGMGIALSAFIQFAAGLSSTIGAFIVQDFARFQELKAAVITWLGLSALTDVVITCILSWYLHTHRTGFSKTDDIITRLVRLTVQTGLITTLWATTDLILYLGWSHNLHLFFQLPLCKLYTNSLMSTLNSRAGWGGSFTSSTTGNVDPMSRSGGGGNGQPTGRKAPAVWRPDQAKSNQTTAIQVMTTATVHRDDGFELEEYGFDTKRVHPEDIEAFGAQSKVQLPGAPSGTAISDETSMHSRGSFEAK